MNIIVWIILGALAGWIASIIMKKNKTMGAIANIVVGILGAFIGKFIMELLGVNVGNGFFVSLLVAILGAVILLWILGFFFGRRR
jgi:uncharacterized membrane protein YeaQ/YmgE (transglycosylase-associated protein family)